MARDVVVVYDREIEIEPFLQKLPYKSRMINTPSGFEEFERPKNGKWIKTYMFRAAYDESLGYEMMYVIDPLAPNWEPRLPLIRGKSIYVIVVELDTEGLINLNTWVSAIDEANSTLDDQVPNKIIGVGYSQQNKSEERFAKMGNAIGIDNLLFHSDVEKLAESLRMLLERYGV